MRICPKSLSSKNQFSSICRIDVFPATDWPRSSVPHGARGFFLSRGRTWARGTAPVDSRKLPSEFAVLQLSLADRRLRQPGLMLPPCVIELAMRTARVGGYIGKAVEVFRIGLDSGKERFAGVPASDHQERHGDPPSAEPGPALGVGGSGRRR